MPTSRTRALEYAYGLIEVPRSHVRITLRQTEAGLSVLHGRRLLTRTYLNRSGINAAAAIAEAAGLKLPRLGQSATTLVSSGLLYRILALSQLDYRNEAALEVASNLVDEAKAMQSPIGDDR